MMPKRSFQFATRGGLHPLRSMDVTASVAAALMGIHERETEFGLWAKKTGKIIADAADNEAMERGRLLEPVAAELLRRDRPYWSILYPVGLYYREPDSRLGASPDLFAIDAERAGFGNIQVKSVEPSIFRRDWRQPDGSIEPPLWIAVQGIVESFLSGASWCAIAALVIGYGVEIHIVDIPLEADEAAIMDGLRRRSLVFWRRVAENDPPPVDYGRDGDMIHVVYAQGDDGFMLDLRDNARVPEIIVARSALRAREADGRAAEIERRKLDAELIHILGDAAFGRLRDGGLLRARTIRGAGGRTYRQIRVLTRGAHA